MDKTQIAVALRTHGYVVVPNVVPPELVFSILRLLNGWAFRAQRKGMSADELEAAKRWHAAPGLEHSLTMDALEALLRPFAEALLGEVREINRHLLSVGPTTELTLPTGYHLDGGWMVKDEETLKEFPGFDLLIGALLTSVKGEKEGGVRIWSGGHLRVEAELRSADPITLLADLTANRVDVGNPTPVIGEAGDIVIAHWALPHGSDENSLAWPSIRAYVRYSSQSRFPGGSDVLRDIYNGWTL